jgi:hypothetical protein
MSSFWTDQPDRFRAVLKQSAQPTDRLRRFLIFSSSTRLLIVPVLLHSASVHVIPPPTTARQRKARHCGRAKVIALKNIQVMKREYSSAREFHLSVR